MMEPTPGLVTATWNEKKRGTLLFADPEKGTVPFAVPPEFRGHPHVIDPEDLFLSAVSACFTSYVLNVAEQMRIKFRSLSVTATDTIDPCGIDFVISGVHLAASATVSSEKDAKKAERAFSLATKGCYIAKSILAEVTVSTAVTVESEESECGQKAGMAAV